MTSAQQQQQMQDVTNSNISINLQELQETVGRIAAHKGVRLVMILNRQGDVLVESSSSSSGGSGRSVVSVTEHARLVKKLIDTAMLYLHTIDEADELSFLQLRSSKNQEVMIAPHQGFVLVVLKCL